MKSYDEFLLEKLAYNKPSGFEVDVKQLNKNLFDWQALLVKWSLFKGKSALFWDTGLGKTLAQLSWSDAICKKFKGEAILGYAPLAVSHQTVREGKKFGIEVNRCDSQSDVKPGINITNYERLEKFNHGSFIGIFLDESGRIKADTAEFTQAVIDSYIKTAYKLCCSATPSPNDYTELGNTSEFLGVMTMSEMKSMFFINDAGDTTAKWRLKGHVLNNRFWEWLSSWCVMIQKPSDIGFSDEGYILPKLNYIEHVIPYKGKKKGYFVEQASGLTEVRDSMRETLEERCKVVADIVNPSKEIWVTWCNLNPEGQRLNQLINNSVEVSGSTKDDLKIKYFLEFSDNKIKCLVTKPKIGMFGMNWQNCNNIVVTGMSHSFEQFYQLIRRFWRYGQTKEVNVHIAYGEREGDVLKTVKRKEKQMKDMFSSMVRHMKVLMKSELEKTTRKETEYNPKIEMKLPSWLEVE